MFLLPKTQTGATKHKSQKREWEVSLVIDTLSKYLDRFVSKPKILEFGSGNGFQIPPLSKVGYVDASDIYDGIDAQIKKTDDFNFTLCSIYDTPFSDHNFDIIFSNQVIEHIYELERAFKEIQRIAKPSSLYVFTVPTNHWLLFSIPAIYWSKSKRYIFRAFSRNSKNKENFSEPVDSLRPPSKKRGLGGKIWRGITPGGHGVYPEFLKCYKEFRISAWSKLFTAHGFDILETKPLLVYAPSSWPIVPTTSLFTRFNICSSVLFIMVKK